MLPGRTFCLAHAGPEATSAYLSSLSPGSDVDLRGTTITSANLASLLAALTDPTTGTPRFGTADFGSATFTETASFSEVTFGKDALFNGAVFDKEVWFSSAAFAKDVWFDSATFEGPQRLGPLLCSGDLRLAGAQFNGPQTVLEAACARLSCERAVFAGTAALRLRYAEVSLSGAVLGGQMALQAYPMPFVRRMDESLVSARTATPAVRLLRLDGVDAANLVLTDIDLTDCEFSGAFHLDQIRLGFGSNFRRPPARWHLRSGVLPARWSRRKTLVEEHHWRALNPGSAGRGWTHGLHHPEARLTPGPDDLTELYQQLRKAFEDSGDEPDAADFYYGEMEMRRHDRSRPRAERQLLWLYWLVSGYGLRASRALACLLGAMAATVLALLLVGLPNADPVPQTRGTAEAGHVRLATSTPDPSLTLPLHERLTADRADKATLVVVNSVIFRSSGQNLTTPGTVVEMLSRIGEPVLLGLAALAIRGRVKR